MWVNFFYVILNMIGVYNKMNKKNEYKNKFKKMVKENKASISNIEELMITNIEEYRQELLTCTEELLIKCIDEKKLVSKKN